jgi:SAM-dependent methyltransferase
MAMLYRAIAAFGLCVSALLNATPNPVSTSCVIRPRHSSAAGTPDLQYSNVKLSLEDIEREAYKRFICGGAEKWERRGAFQLFFLQKMGLKPQHAVLDVGCGPLRGGVHLIRYLDRRLYYGIDYNADFIRAAQKIVKKDALLEQKSPVVRQLNDFDFASSIFVRFEFILLFSVLNHCNNQQIRRFMTQIPRVMKSESKIYITHGQWFEASMLSGTPLRLSDQFAHAADVSRELNMEKWGFPGLDSVVPYPVFPILELGLSPSPIGDG